METAFKRSVGELEIQNIWRRSLHLILDCFDKSNPSETVQLNKSTFETFTRSEGCKAKLSTTVNTLDLKSDPTRKRRFPSNKARKDKFSLSEHAFEYKAPNHVMKNTCKSRQKLKRNANGVEEFSKIGETNMVHKTHKHQQEQSLSEELVEVSAK